MLSEAGKYSLPIQFNRDVPGSAQFVVDGYAVPGAFTAKGAAFMLDAFKQVDQYLNGESWVVGADTTAVDAAGLAAQIQSRYSADYIAQWQQFLQTASVVRYADMKDAATKLAALSGNQSPLLALFSMVARNTAIALPGVAKTFQSTHVITPPDGDRLSRARPQASDSTRVVSSASQAYVSALAALQASLDRAANAPDTGVDQARDAALERASAARSAVQQVASRFTIDQSGVQSIVQTLMMAPITYAEPLLRKSAVSDVNARARAFCSSIRSLLTKFPFAPYATLEDSLDQVAAVFRPKTGTLWRFYDNALVAVLPKRQGQYVPVAGGSVQLAPSFVSFINRAATISDVLFADGSTPRLTIKAVPLSSRTSGSIALAANGVLNRSGAPFDWPGTGGDVKLVAVDSDTTIAGPYSGPWAIFRLFSTADDATPGPDGSVTFRWLERKGKMVNPNPKASVRVEAGPAAIALRNGFFSGVSCGGEAAK
jgi:type VI secretion system protein ImpL